MHLLRSRRRSVVATGAAALLLALAACGSSETPAASTTSQAATTSASSAPSSSASASGSSSAPTSGSSEAPTSSGPAKQLTIREGFAGAALSPSTAMYTSIPQALGFWKEEGLTVDIERVEGTATALTSMSGGQLDISVISGEPVIIAAGEDLKYTIPYSLSQKGIVTTVVLKDSPIKELKDLSGKTVGAPTMTSGAITFTQAALSDAGLDPNSVTFVAVGTGAPAAAALTGGQVAALVDTDTAVAAFQAAGADVRVVDTPLRDKLVMGIVAAGTTEYITGNKDAVTAWARGVAKATLWMAAHPEDAVKVHYQVYPDEKPDGAEADVIALGVAQIQARLSNILPADKSAKLGLLTDQQLQDEIDFLLKSKTLKKEVPTSAFWDGSMIDAINDFDRAKVEALPAPSA
jgi:NitT/TauT family transport system substrate-binding protein